MRVQRSRIPDRGLSGAAACLVLGTLLAVCVDGSADALQAHAGGPASVDLGTAGEYAILAKAGVSTTAGTKITGNVGVSPVTKTSLTGFDLVEYAENVFATSALVAGNLYAATNTPPIPANLITAVLDMETAYTNAMARPVELHNINLNGGALGGTVIKPGVYRFDTAVGFSDDCTLRGSADDIWIFQVEKKMKIATGKSIILAGGAQARNIVWAVKEAATFAVGSHFEGIILGKTSAVFQTGASINGRVLVQTAVTLDQVRVVHPASA